jgi:hypothetical protein
MPAGRYRFFAHSTSLGVRDFGLREVAAAQTLELGELRFSAPGRLRVKLVGPHEALAAFDPTWMRAQVRGPEEFILGQIEFDEKLEGLSGALPAGACTIRLFGGNYRARIAAVEVVAGSEQELAIELQSATSRNFRVTWDPTLTPKGLLNYVVSDAAGNVIEENTRQPQPDGESRIIVAGLVVGSYWIDVKSNDGRSARISFIESDLAASLEWTDIPLR